MSSEPSVEVGRQLPPLRMRLDRTDLVRYAGASGDSNPIHHSDFFAAELGLPGVIAHGMLTMAAALRVVTDWTGDPAAVTGYAVRFTKPVVVPDDGAGAELLVTAEVTDVTDGHATVKISAVVPGQGVEGTDEKVLGMATAVVDLALITVPSGSATESSL